MTHTIYTTEAIVINRVDTADVDLTLWLLTKDLGLIVAKASGVRKEAAKMRNYLQTFNLLNVALVRGRYVWRLTGAESYTQKVDKLTGKALINFANISNFLRRMTIPEGSVDLYRLLVVVRKELILAKSDKDLRRIEVLAMAKILVQLGYMSSSILSHKPIRLSKLIVDINKAINESHL